MKAHEKVRDAASAQALKGDHERIKAEIEAREDVFQAVVDNGQSMVEEGMSFDLKRENRNLILYF